VKYPRILFTPRHATTACIPATRARWFAKMDALHQDILYYENIEGGHGGAANNQQQAYMNALAYTFLLKQLK